MQSFKDLRRSIRVPAVSESLHQIQASSLFQHSPKEFLKFLGECTTTPVRLSGFTQVT
jgi:hypothetical protein